ncbi:2-phosphoxylose phosphatase 1 [Smittium culicis]|nr:2-phosphoxylose phosphatase 1 [Smittium culicis]
MSQKYQCDFLESRICHKIPFPCNKLGKCANKSDAKVELDGIHFETRFSFRDNKNSLEYVKLTASPLFDQLMKELEFEILKRKRNDKPIPRTRLSIYSGHESTINKILGGFKADDFNILFPPYNANVIIELWKSKISDNYKIRIFNNGRILKVLPIEGYKKPWCDLSECDYKVYSKYIYSLIPKNYTAECLV